MVSITKNAANIQNGNATGGISAPSRVGYVFAGWSRSADGTSADYAADAVADVPDGTVLYAVWQVAPENPEQ